MRFFLWMWNLIGVLIGIFGFYLALSGSVNPKELAGWQIDAQLSAWIYGVMFAGCGSWISDQLNRL